MTDRLPPETARRFLDLHAAVQERGPWTDHGPIGSLLRAITPEDIAALEVLCPDRVAATLTIPDGLAAVYDGEGTYDHYERAGWVKREPEPVAEPEEWGPWVKLAVVGERPDRVEFEIDEALGKRSEERWTIRGTPCGTWSNVTHYRRKRIRRIYEQGGIDGDYTVWRAKDGHDGAPGLGDVPGAFALRGALWTPATVPEVTAAKAGRDPNGVVSWAGGESSPVDSDARGYWHLRRGAVRGSNSLHDRVWTNDGDGSDIIAYEVAE